MLLDKFAHSAAFLHVLLSLTKVILCYAEDLPRTALAYTALFAQENVFRIFLRLKGSSNVINCLLTQVIQA